MLHCPRVAVRVGEEDKRVPVAARPLDAHPVVEVLNGGHVDAAFDQLGPGGVDVAHYQLQALQRPRWHVTKPGADRDLAPGARRCELYDAEMLAHPHVRIDVETDL